MPLYSRSSGFAPGLLPAPAAAPVTTSYFASDIATNGWYAGPVYPPHIYFADTNTTWLFHEGWNSTLSRRQIEVQTYNHSTALWTPPVAAGVTTLTDDSHGVPAAVRDGDGYVHVFYGAHIAPQQMASTRLVNDPSRWINQTAISDNYSYPRPFYVGGVIYLFHRNDTDQNQRLGSVTPTTALTAGIPTWGARKDLINLDPDSRFYAMSGFLVGTDVHLVFCRANAADEERRHAFYMIYKTTTGAVTNITGSVSVAAASQPVAWLQVLADFPIYVHATGHDGTSPAFAMDTSGFPHVFVTDGVVTVDPLFNSPAPVYHLKHDGVNWSAPVDTGIRLKGRRDGVNAWQKPNGVIGIAWTQLDGGSFGAGGNIWSMDRSAAGVFSTPTQVGTAGTYALASTAPVRDAHVDIRAAWTEISQDVTVEVGTLKGTAFGDSGIFSRTVSTAWTFVNSEASAYNARRGTPLGYDDGYYIDQLFTVIKSIGISKFIALYIATDNEADSFLNLISNTFPLVKTNTCTFAAKLGWTGDGASGFLDTGYTPSSSGGVLTQNSAHLSGWGRVTNDNDVNLCGASDGTFRIDIIPRNASDQATFRVNDGTNVGFANTTSAGHYLANRSAAGARQLYKNGAQLTSGSTASTGLPTATIHMLGASTAFSTNQLWMGSFGSSLTATEALDFHLALRTIARMWGVV